MSFSSKRWFRTALGVLALLALIGFSATAWIVKNEGWDGLWDRKRQWIESTHPAAGPILDEAEERVLRKTGNTEQPEQPARQRP